MYLLETRIQKTKRYIEGLGTHTIPHIHSLTLFHHLVRVQEILASWEFDEDVQIFGLCHSLYGTQSFKDSLLNIHKRDYLIGKFGNWIEQMIYYFAVIDRKSLNYDSSIQSFNFTNRLTKEKIITSESNGKILLNVLFANELDHIGVLRTASHTQSFRMYDHLSDFLVPKARKEFEKLVTGRIPIHIPRNEPFIRFIAHSGVQIANTQKSIVIDPWVYDSSRENPLIDSFDPTQRTIDYLIPEPKNTIKELAPDIICISHFHTHHSPLREILEAASIKKITVISPLLDARKLEIIRQKAGDYILNRIDFQFVTHDTVIQIDDVTIQAFVHRKDHLMFTVSLVSKTILHIVDAVANDEREPNRTFSKKWERLDAIKPDFMFVGAAGHMEKRIIHGVRHIVERATLTPAQAAQLAARILPRYAGIIGIYNHSVWDDRYEMALSVGEAEAQFYWCLSFLAPSIEIKKLLPGDTVA